MKLIYGKWYTKEIYTFLFVIKLFFVSVLKILSYLVQLPKSMVDS